MDVTIIDKPIFQHINSAMFRTTASQMVGRDITWTILDRGNSFEFLEVCGNLALVKCTIHSPISQELTAFMNYLDLFYNLDTSDLKDILQRK